MASAAYTEVLEVEVEYSESVLDDTLVTVVTEEGEEFILIVSPEDGRDREFVSELERRIPEDP